MHAIDKSYLVKVRLNPIRNKISYPQQNQQCVNTKTQGLTIEWQLKVQSINFISKIASSRSSVLKFDQPNSPNQQTNYSQTEDSVAAAVIVLITAFCRY